MSGYQNKIRQFLASGPFAVVGASANPLKYGHKCLLAYINKNLPVYPVNPRAGTILGRQCFPDLRSIPVAVQSVSIVTPPEVTEAVVEEALELGISNLWMQPGADSLSAVLRAKAAEANLIFGGPCLMVELGGDL